MDRHATASLAISIAALPAIALFPTAAGLAAGAAAVHFSFHPLLRSHSGIAAVVAALSAFEVCFTLNYIALRAAAAGDLLTLHGCQAMSAAADLTLIAFIIGLAQLRSREEKPAEPPDLD